MDPDISQFLVVLEGGILVGFVVAVGVYVATYTGRLVYELLRSL